MSIPLLITYIVAAAAALLSLTAEYRRAAMMMQQNSYRTDRYMRWLRSSGDTTSYPRLVGMLVLFGSLASFSTPLWGIFMIAVFSSGSFIVAYNKKYKKPLVVTPRVKRILSVMAVLSLVVVAGVFVWAYFAGSGLESELFYAVVSVLGLYCGSHVVIMTAIRLLSPVEKSINRKYYDEAASILASMPRLQVVGITGSYGKTSTKHYLNRILSEHFEVLMTPGSYNTTLGVIRTVREMMKPYCEVFICEMGAKQQGDIKEICDLVHPQIGVVTAVGPQHLESFKSLENVQRTKFELIDSLPSVGLAVVNNDFPMVASRTVDNVECVRYGVNDENVDYRATEIAYGASGTDFVIEGEGEKRRFHTRLLGECNVSNLVAAIVVAMRMGVPEEKIYRAVERIEPVEHRLSMKRTSAGVTILDDAFNSNPSGSSMALDVLAAMTSGKRIIVTPGMIELGDKQYGLNHEFGAKIAVSADVAIIVGEYNRDAIVGGMESVENAALRIMEAPTFTVAQQMLAGIVASGDTVLYENDLPDTFK